MKLPGCLQKRRICCEETFYRRSRRQERNDLTPVRLHIDALLGRNKPFRAHLHAMTALPNGAFPSSATQIIGTVEKVAVDDTGRVAADGEVGIDGRAIRGLEIRLANSWHSKNTGMHTYGHHVRAMQGLQIGGNDVALWAVTTMDAREILQQGSAVLRGLGHQ